MVSHFVPIAAAATGLALVSKVAGVPTRFVVIGAVAAAFIARRGQGQAIS
jgi:hypothetical protein